MSLLSNLADVKGLKRRMERIIKAEEETIRTMNKLVKALEEHRKVMEKLVEKLG